MGIDTVEIAMEVEEHYGMTFSEEEFVRVFTSGGTVADLIRVCQSRIQATDATHCQTLPNFMAVRQLAREVMADPTFRVRPHTLIEEAMPVAKRRDFWKLLPRLLHRRLPSLDRTASLRLAMKLLVGATLLGVAWAQPVLLEFKFLLLFLIIAGVVMLFLHVITRPFRTVPPKGYKTFGEIARRMTGLKVATKPPARSDSNSILEELRPIITHVLGIDEDEVVQNARFIQDLGAG